MVDDRMADRVVELMNEMLAADPAATRALLINRVPCNDALCVDHPTIQCGKTADGCDIGLMGVLNGLCGAYDDGPRKGYGGVCFDMEGEGETLRVLRFRRLANGAGE